MRVCSAALGPITRPMIPRFEEALRRNPATKNRVWLPAAYESHLLEGGFDYAAEDAFLAPM